MRFRLSIDGLGARPRVGPCRIPLPPWVHEAIDHDGDIVYTDKSGRRNREYLSLSVDDLPVLRGRTPIQAYSDFMRSFRDNFKEYLGSVITVGPPVLSLRAGALPLLPGRSFLVSSAW